MEDSAVVLWKVPIPIDVTPAGTVMEDSAVAPLNAHSPIDVRVLVPSNVTLASEVALPNAPYPIDVTLAGMVIEVSAAAPLNADVAIDVTPAGITTAPTHAVPADTTPEVILKFGVESDGKPVLQS